MKRFICDGIKGTIDSNGWIEWMTIGCHIESLSGSCALKRAALRARVYL